MPDLQDGESVEMQGSGKSPYILKNTGGVYSCTCPAWRNQSLGIEKRTCKHLRKLRGDAAETERVGNTLPVRKQASEEGEEEGKGSPLLLAHVWENDVDLAGWWMSEKLDGVRAYWDGRQLISRLGNALHAPDWFVAGLPKSPLDGELWLERKAFQKTVSIVRRQDKSDHWKQIRYVVFDAPALDEPFEERLKFVADALAASQSEFVLPHEHRECKSVDHLRAELARIESLGGEGLMLRQPGSRYEAGRSMTLLKVKTFHDADGVVVAHVPGKGRHKGRVGALVVHLADGTAFSVGTGLSDKERERPPAIGSTITFRYQELSTGGVPRFPSFVRMRKDARK
jgi:DNA ligase-1